MRGTIMKTEIRFFIYKHKKKLKLVGIVFAAFLLVSIIAQLVYPSSRTLPKQKIGGVTMGYKDVASLKTHLWSTQQDMQLHIETADKQQDVAWQDMGITIDEDKVVENAFNYPWYQRIIPLSSVYKVVTDDKPITTRIDEVKLKEYTDKLSADSYRSPANASLSINGTSVNRNEQKPGIKYDGSSVADQIKTTSYQKGARVKLAGTDVPSAFSAAEVEAVAQKAEALIATETKVDTAGKVQVVPAAEKASWLKFTETADAQHLAIDIDREKAKNYLSTLNKDIYKAPGSMTITMRDGVELQRSADTSGQSLDLSNGANILAGGVLGNSADAVKVPIIKVPPKITYQRSYTKSQAGFNALLNDIAGEEPDMSISLRALDGSGIAASAKGSKQYHPASTYKLPVAYSAIKRIEAGTLQWTDDVNGRNVEKCIADMIIVSDNPCASALGNKLGWQAVTDDARAIGMGGTNLAKGFVSTANDQATFLAKLQGGSLMSGPNRDKLINYMKQQRYRNGIPAGVGGAVVADKVGFVDALLHDSAIVYAPKGTYVLVIYSNKGSWARMSAATTKIHNLMNQ